MSVAGSVRALELVFDRSDYAQHARAIGTVDAKTIGTLEQGQRFGLLVTAVASLSIFIDCGSHFGGLRRVADESFGIENAKTHHAGLVGHVGHQLIEAV